MNSHIESNPAEPRQPSVEEGIPAVNYETQYERSKTSHEPSSRDSNASDATQTTSATQYAVNDGAADGDSAPQTAQTDSDTPLIADDVDLIEKEWVNKAKKIIAMTADDPYTQENEIEKLQIDYLYKRFGKKIKSSNE